MSVPRELVLGPVTYTISTSLVDVGRACRDQGEVLLGATDHPSLRIVVDPDQAPGQARDTLLHESLHAVFQISGLSDEWGDAKEERVIRRVSPWILELIRSNPALVAFLTGDE